MTKEEKAKQDAEVRKASDLFHAIQSELEILNERQESLRHLLKDFDSEEWGRKNWSEDSEFVLGEINECLRDLGKLAK